MVFISIRRSVIFSFRSYFERASITRKDKEASDQVIGLVLMKGSTQVSTVSPLLTNISRLGGRWFFVATTVNLMRAQPRAGNYETTWHTPCERIDSLGDVIEQLQVIRITDTMFAPSKGNARVKDFSGSFLPFWSERILPPKYKYGLIRRNTCSRFKPNLCVSLVNIVKYSYSKIYQVTSITNCY